MKTEKLSKVTIKKLRQTKWQRIKDYEMFPRHDSLKTQLLSIISQSNQKLKKIFKIGMNSVMKSIEMKHCSVVCLCRDTPKNLLDSLVDACLFHKIPIATLPATSAKEVAEAFSMKKTSCFALPTVQSLENQALDDQQVGLVDGLREVLLDLSNLKRSLEDSTA
jgi:ribosomal protein L7Ae-like RNA K-turn-binding protein